LDKFACAVTTLSTTGATTTTDAAAAAATTTTTTTTTTSRVDSDCQSFLYAVTDDCPGLLPDVSEQSYAAIPRFVTSITNQKYSI
jgi:hypothetical protein